MVRSEFNDAVVGQCFSGMVTGRWRWTELRANCGAWVVITKDRSIDIVKRRLAIMDLERILVEVQARYGKESITIVDLNPTIVICFATTLARFGRVKEHL